MRSPPSGMLFLGTALAVAGLTLHCGGGTASECDDADGCLPNELCIDNECVPNEGWTCGTGQPCPDGQYCCASTCGSKRCCTVHTDCTDGYCKDNRCQDGIIPGCPEVACPTGVCDPNAGICVECTRNSHCQDPQICGVSQTCVDLEQNCGDTACPWQTPFCAPQEGCRPCIENTADCGDQVCDNGSCVPCEDLGDRSCPGGRFCNPDGICVTPTGVWCGDDEDCGEYVCTHVAGKYWNECMACTLLGECGFDRDCDLLNGGVCEASTPVCVDDRECSPPYTVCDAGLCVAGCERMSCHHQGHACHMETGRCFPIHPGADSLGRFGETCASHDECASGACWAGNINDSSASLCTWPCVKQNDCPDGAVCWELGDSNVCVSIDLAFNYPLPALDQPPGAACDDPEIMSLDCRSGYCHRLTQTSVEPACMEMCARDADCDGLSVDDMICVSGWPIGEDLNNSGVLDEDEILGFSQLCHEGWGHLGPNQPCGSAADGSPLPTDQDDCRSGWCVQTPDRREQAHCAQPCCTPSDCGPDNPICKPIDVWDGWREANEDNPYGFQKICLWREYIEGTLEVGEVCTSDSQ